MTSPPTDPALHELWRLFANPADEARPRAWWHWMDGNVDPEGIRADLAWLHRIGVRGAQLFDGGMGVPVVVASPVRPGSAEWRDAVGTATSTAAELGMELAVATSSGWSASGGPWVEPADAMKKVVWSETVVGSGPVDVELAPLPAVRGLYQDCPRWGEPPSEAWATDWVTVAIPDAPELAPLPPDGVAASGPLDGADALIDGSFARGVSLARDPDGRSDAWIEQSFARPVTVRSVVVGLPGPRGFGAAPQPDALLQASDDGVTYRDVAVLEPAPVPVRTASFAPVTARRFRIVLSADSAASALPATAEGVRVPPVVRPSSAFEVTEFALRAAALVHRAELKGGFGVAPDYYRIDTDSTASASATRALDVIDLTAHVHDGRLRWSAPDGRWRVLRFGASLTGQTNGPAPADSTGLEVDKLDGSRVRAYLSAHLESFTGSADGDGFTAMLSDSIEAGPQNWTDRIAERFRERRGYELTGWVPALAGYVVADARSTDAFLYDYRRTIAELLADEYYGTLGAEARRRGMLYYAEALEDGRPQLGDDLSMRAHADVPMGAMWTFDPDTGPAHTYVADLKGASSVAHVRGRKWVGAEAFTSFGRPWASTPGSLKHVADLQLSLGVTRFCIHTSPHQPIAAPPPGIALAPFLGQVFTRHETWADLAGPWIDYLSRCCAVLSSGEPVVDFAVFVGEEAAVTGLYAHAPDRTIPDGFDFDYVGAAALEDDLRFEGGALVSGGASYRALVLSGSSGRMTLDTLLRIEQLLDAGATIVGTRPAQSPSLVDDADEFETACDRVWAPDRTAGRVLPSIEDAVHVLALTPGLVIEGVPLRRIARRVGGRLVTFLANPCADPVAVRLRTDLDEGDVLLAWDPVTVERRELSLEADRSWSLELPPFGSVLVLPGPPACVPPAEQPPTVLPLDGAWTVQLPGSEPRALGDHPRPWTELDAGARSFSGTAIYRTDIHLNLDSSASARISLDGLHGVARIIVNGTDCGVAWTPPYLLDVTSAMRPGANRIEIHVATPWRNRLIAEASAPSGDVFAPMTEVFEPSAAPLAAGISGAEIHVHSR